MPGGIPAKGNLMEAAKILRTDPQPERALTFVEHIRLKCETCGIIIQPTELERALWFDNRVCPRCADEEQRSSCDSEFDNALYESDSKLQKRINQLESELKSVKSEHEALLEEAQCLTEKHQWLSKNRIEQILWLEDAKCEFELDLSELDF